MKKKNIFTAAALTVMTIMMALQPVTAQAASNKPAGYAEVAGDVSQYYKVGEAFRANEVGLNIYESNGGARYYTDQLEFTANGNKISNGYKFQEAGRKIITVKRYDKQANYEIQVDPAVKGEIKECYLAASPSKTTYRQGIEGFDPKDIVVTCVLTNGTTQNLGYKELVFHARAKGENGEGVVVRDGYRFKKAGEKELIIQVQDYETTVPLTVTPYFTKDVARVEMVKEPSKFTYKVGESFRASEFAARCFYSDGTTEEINNKAMYITANGTQIYEGYKFQVAGKKSLVIEMGDYTVTYDLTVK